MNKTGCDGNTKFCILIYDINNNLGHTDVPLLSQTFGYELY